LLSKFLIYQVKKKKSKSIQKIIIVPLAHALVTNTKLKRRKASTHKKKMYKKLSSVARRDFKKE